MRYDEEPLRSINRNSRSRSSKPKISLRSEEAKLGVGDHTITRVASGWATIARSTSTRRDYTAG